MYGFGDEYMFKDCNSPYLMKMDRCNEYALYKKFAVLTPSCLEDLADPCLDPYSTVCAFLYRHKGDKKPSAAIIINNDSLDNNDYDIFEDLAWLVIGLGYKPKNIKWNEFMEEMTDRDYYEYNEDSPSCMITTDPEYLELLPRLTCHEESYSDGCFSYINKIYLDTLLVEPVALFEEETIAMNKYIPFPQKHDIRLIQFWAFAASNFWGYLLVATGYEYLEANDFRDKLAELYQTIIGELIEEPFCTETDFKKKCDRFNDFVTRHLRWY